MGKWIIFEDSVSDQHAYPSNNVNGIFIESATSIVIYARNPVQPTESVSDDKITLVVTSGTADTMLDLLISNISDNSNITTINNINFSITSVAWAVGA